MPIKMDVNPGNPNQVRDAFDSLVSEMRANGSQSGILCAQSYNQMHWSANPDEEGFKKHGFIGEAPNMASKSTWSGRVHQNEGLAFEGFDGVIDVLGGDWQNAVYQVTLGGGEGPMDGNSTWEALNGSYVSFRTDGNPDEVVDRFEARLSNNGRRIDYYRNGNKNEGYDITGNTMTGPVSAAIQPNGDIVYSHGYTSRKVGSGAQESMGNEAPQLVLTERGADNQCVFADIEKVKAGGELVLVLSNHPDKGIGRKYPEERMAGPWRYTESGCGPAEFAVRVHFEDDAFLVLTDADLCLDVAFWNMEIGNAVNFVGGTNENEKTKMGDGGRDWVINDDGTIGSKHHPHLVLGIAGGFNEEGPATEGAVDYGRMEAKTVQGSEVSGETAAFLLTDELSGGGDFGTKKSGSISSPCNPALPIMTTMPAAGGM